eukprot:102053-Pyramimonas_sp.AAC.1
MAGDPQGAFALLQPHAERQEPPPDALVLAMYGFLAATGRLGAGAQSHGVRSFQRGVETGSGHGAVVCALFSQRPRRGAVRRVPEGLRAGARPP